MKLTIIGYNAEVEYNYLEAFTFDVKNEDEAFEYIDTLCTLKSFAGGVINLPQTEVDIVNIHGEKYTEFAPRVIVNGDAGWVEYNEKGEPADWSLDVSLKYWLEAEGFIK